MAEPRLVVLVKDLRLSVQEKPTTAHYNSMQRFPWCVSVQWYGSLAAALDVGSLCTSIILRWWGGERRGLGVVSDLIAYRETRSQLANCIKKHETLRFLLGKEKCTSCQVLKPSCPTV